MVTGVVPPPPRFLPSIFIAHRVQQSHCSSISHRVLLTHALALSASQFVHKKKSQRIYTSMHSAGLELTKLTYTRLEDNLIRHIAGWHIPALQRDDYGIEVDPGRFLFFFSHPSRCFLSCYLDVTWFVCGGRRFGDRTPSTLPFFLCNSFKFQTHHPLLRSYLTLCYITPGAWP